MSRFFATSWMPYRIPLRGNLDLEQVCLLFWQACSVVPVKSIPTIVQVIARLVRRTTDTGTVVGITVTGISGAVSWAETAVPPGAPAETNYYLYAVCHWVYRIFF